MCPPKSLWQRPLYDQPLWFYFSIFCNSVIVSIYHSSLYLHFRKCKFTENTSQTRYSLKKNIATALFRHCNTILGRTSNYSMQNLNYSFDIFDSKKNMKIHMILKRRDCEGQIIEIRRMFESVGGYGAGHCFSIWRHITRHISLLCLFNHVSWS